MPEMMPELSMNSLAAAADQRARFAAAYSVLQKAVDDRAFPGAAFGVISRGEIVALDALGQFTFDEAAPHVLPSTVFDLASLTKVVATTSTAMILHQRGVLDLDMPLGDVLPGFVIGQRSGGHKHLVTFRMLLAHSSGLPAYEPLFRSAKTPNEILAACLLMPLENAPMKRALYSDIGFILLGKALELLSGETLSTFNQREVFAPLGMAHTGYCIPRDRWPSIPPTELDTTFRHRVIQGEVHDENCSVLGGCAGHAGLFSNVPDLLCFAQTILAPLKEPSIFDPEIVSLFGTRQASPQGSSRALGWDTPSEPSSSGKLLGPRSLGHLGYTGTSLWMDPDRELAVVLLTNRTWPDRSRQEIKQIRPAFHNAVITSLQ